MRLKKRGILTSFRRDDGVEPKFAGPPVGRGSCMCGFMLDYVVRCKPRRSSGREAEDG
jgi:hypothetical protein